jgi:aspartate kinase
MISTSEIKISCVISQKDGKKALELLHNEFGLDQ